MCQWYDMKGYDIICHGTNSLYDACHSRGSGSHCKALSRHFNTWAGKPWCSGVLVVFCRERGRATISCPMLLFRDVGCRWWMEFRCHDYLDPQLAEVGHQSSHAKCRIHSGDHHVVAGQLIPHPPGHVDGRVQGPHPDPKLFWSDDRRSPFRGQCLAVLFLHFCSSIQVHFTQDGFKVPALLLETYGEGRHFERPIVSFHWSSSAWIIWAGIMHQTHDVTYLPHKAVSEVSNHNNEPIGRINVKFNGFERQSISHLVVFNFNWIEYQLTDWLIDWLAGSLTNWLTD